MSSEGFETICTMPLKHLLKALDHSPKSYHVKLLKRAKSGLLQQRVTILLSKGNAKKWHSLAVRKDVDVVKVADKIMSDYLKRR